LPNIPANRTKVLKVGRKGELDWADGTLRFTGKADGSASLLFEFLKSLMDKYLKGINQ
jgi:hypothetical protein